MSSAAETPKPPDDPELRNIIDKLAQFVARNGSEFENMTKQKQKENPRFSFLFGGEYFQYYVYKVNAEQAIMRKQKMQSDQGTTAQIQILKHQLRESEKNLSLQYEALMKQRQSQIDDATFMAERDQIQKLAEQFNVNLSDLTSLLDCLQTSCSKESIASNKNWFLAHCQSQQSSEIVVKFFISNMRKQNQPMMSLLGSYVCTAFCCVYVCHGLDDSCKEKLEKLKSIWQTQKYFGENIEKKLSNIQETYDEYRKTLNQNFSTVVHEISEKIRAQYQQYETQHLNYAKHMQQQISLLEMSVNAAPPSAFSRSSQQLPTIFQQTAPVQLPPQLSSPAEGVQPVTQRRSRFDAGPPQQPKPLMSSLIYPTPSSAVSVSQSMAPYANEQAAMLAAQQQTYGSRPPWLTHLDQQPLHGSAYGTTGGTTYAAPSGTSAVPAYPPPGYGSYQQPPPQAVAGQPMNVAQPLMSLSTRPPAFAGMRVAGPPFGPPMGPSGWRPGAGPLVARGTMMAEQALRQIHPQPLVPKVPYYDLPAALMVPLVQLSDDSYEPLDPRKIRLPPPMAPSERLLAAVEAFYAPPNHENPRDSDGWERLGLYEFFKAKQDAIRQKNEEQETGDANEFEQSHRAARAGSTSSINSKQSNRSGSADGRSNSASPERNTNVVR